MYYTKTEFETEMNKLMKNYCDVARMTTEAYNDNFIIDSLYILENIDDYNLQERKIILSIIYDILSTEAGKIFIQINKDFAKVALAKTKEFIEIVSYSDIDMRLYNSMLNFIEVNKYEYITNGYDINITTNITRKQRKVIKKLQKEEKRRKRLERLIKYEISLYNSKL